MATVASWHGHEFGIQPGKIIGFRDLRVTSEAETEEKEQGDDKWLQWKAYKPKKVNITCVFNARLGVDAWTEAENLIRDLGYKDYFYFAGYKLLPERLMLTKAEMYDAQIGANIRYWESVLVDCTFEVAEAGALAWGTRQAAGGSASSSSSASSGGGSSGGGGTRNYRVQIPGMSQVVVSAASEQAALNRAQKGWTGTVYIDGKTRYAVKGVLTTKSKYEASKTAAKSSAQQHISAINKKATSK